MKIKLFFCLALVLSGGLAGCSTYSSAKLSRADSIVEEMRGLNMQPGNPAFDDGSINPQEQHREEIISQLRLTGDEAAPALIRALKDPDVQMRRNADLVIFELAWGYDSKPMDMRPAIPALIRATADEDGMVRAWAAMALGEIGPDAKAAVPALIKLVCDPDEGCRNDACIALGDIGPAARDALPALRNALNEPSKDTRQFAKRAIDKLIVCPTASPAANDPSLFRVHNWQYIQYSWAPHGPTFSVGWACGGNQRSLEMSQGFRLDILDLTQGFAFFQTNAITARLYRANGEIVEPTPEGKKLLNAPIAISTASFGGWAPQVMTYFPWGPNVLEECWIEVTIPPDRYWVEVPYGFDRNPADPLAPVNTNGPPKFVPAMKSLTEHDHVVRWQDVHYDLGEIQDGWRLSLVQSNSDEAVSQVVLYAEDVKMTSAKSWDAAAWKTNSPTTALRLLDATGTIIGSHCIDTGLRYDGMGYTYDLVRYGNDQRCWGQIEISVGDKTYGVVVPSSLYKNAHGHARR